MTPANWPFPGSRWWKFDFHTHTPVSTDTPWHALVGTANELTPEAWLLKFMAADIDCVAITDHNSGAWIDRLKEAYAGMEGNKPVGFRELHIFPGVEISVQGGFHLLAIFDKPTRSEDITRLLGQVDYDGSFGDSDGVTRKGGAEVIKAILNAGGIPIPAHVDDNFKGLLRARPNEPKKCAIDSNTVLQILKIPELRAMEVLEPEFNPPDLVQHNGIRWAHVVGSDCHNFRPPYDKLPGSRFTWIKMGASPAGGPTLESLRLALVDGNDISIKRSENVGSDWKPFGLPKEFIESVRIDQGRFIGQGVAEQFTFSPLLNAIVGGRGSGKSTVLQFLRLALRRHGEIARIDPNSEVRRGFERFQRVSKGGDDDGAVLTDTRVSVVFQHQGERFQILWPDVTGQSSVQTWDSATQSWKSANSQTVADRFPVRIFSQGQIAVLAGEKSEALLDIINQAVNFTEWKSRWDEEERAFLTLRTRIRELEGKLQNRDRVVGSLDDVRRKLARFEEAEHAKVLKEFQTRSRQAKELESQVASAREKVTQLEALAQQLVPSDVGIGIFSESEPLDQEATANISRIRESIASAKLAVRNAAQRLTDDVNAEVALANQTAWHTAVTAARAAYDKLVADLHTQGVNDPSEYGQLAQDSQRLELEVKGLDSLNQSLTTLRSQATEKLDFLQALRREITVKRQEFLARVLSNNTYVRIKLRPYGREASTIAQSLRSVLGLVDETSFSAEVYSSDDKTGVQVGVVPALLGSLPADSSANSLLEGRIRDLKEILRKACVGEETQLHGKFQQRLLKEYTQRPEYLDRIMTWFPEDSLSVTYSAKGDGEDFRPITQGSAGQKAAAMLAFLLAYGDEPILVDQPEDDLDNHLIYGLVVRQIRENKQRRQIITVTHNPNIVVNGDAEMVHSLDFKSGQCRVTEKGSLQEAAVRDEICRVMEGGRDAFEQRYRRIGKGGSRV